MSVAPLLITGMHRSGTSATARVLHHAGLDLGDRLLAPTLDNALGYYEDVEFCELNLTLVATGVGDDPSHQPDWAFADRIVPERLVPLAPRAAALVAARRAAGRAWGFKDPRTTVLLDFYDELIPDARYLFVYRPPWDVLASLMNTWPRPLHGRADVAVRAWTHYNRRILDFRSTHPGRTVLVHVDAVGRDPAAVVDRVEAHADPAAPRLDRAAAARAFEPRLLHRTEQGAALAELLHSDHPEAEAVYERLEEAADLPSGANARAGGPPRVDVETRPGGIPVAAVLAGAPADGLEDTRRIARPVDVSDPAYAADAGVLAVPDDLVVVLFAGQLWEPALRTAVSALGSDPGCAGVLLAAAPASGPHAVAPYDPLHRVDGAAGIVLRRSTWLAVRGFTSAPAPEGFEAWAFAVACVAQGLRVVRIEGAIHLQAPPVADDAVVRAVLTAHPGLLLDRLRAVQASADGGD